ncbi:hypothetical protein F4861DRAFT_213761 [Xylaria intraflava]|nr:hypothetical protein F4861DRAFT_213761 [Xylaria intraflava]
MRPSAFASSTVATSRAASTSSSSGPPSTAADPSSSAAQPSVPTPNTTPGATADAPARPIYSPTAASSDPGSALPGPHAPIPYKRGLSLSADGDVPSPASSASLPGPRETAAAAVPPDQRTVKKRRTGPGSRGVASLTPEQLAKKRANDREAQRAIRERTKNQIEAFENRIRELTSQEPYQELQKVIRQKEAVEAENAELKANMASIVAMIQPFLSGRAAEGAYVSPVPTYASMQSAQQQQHQHRQHQQRQQHQQQQQQQQQSLSFSAHNVSTPGSAVSPRSGMDSPRQGQALSQPTSHRHLDTHDLKTATQQWQDYVPYLDIGGGEHLQFDFLVDPSQRLNRMQPIVNGDLDPPAYQQLPLKQTWGAPTYPGYCGNALDNGAPPPPPSAQQHQFQHQNQHQHHHQNHPQQQQQHHQNQNQHHQHPRIEYARGPMIPPRPPPSGPNAFIKHCQPVCPLDGILLDFLRERRQRAAEGVPTHELVGPRYPSVSSLLNPAISSHTLHPLSKVFTDVLMAFPTICGLPEKVAVLYVMFMVMRWQISPTEENYELIPPFSRPLPSQFTHPHPAWVDHVPFPAMRERLVHDYAAPELAFDGFVVPYTTTLSLNWPHEDTDALLETPDGREIIINPDFQRHICRSESWTLGDAFDSAFGGLRGLYNLKRGDPRVVSRGALGLG